MLQLKAILFTVLLAVTALAQQGEDCPNRATECPPNCGGAQCPRFLTAKCEENRCHGLCTPNFMWRGKNVTGRCNIERCSDKECPGKRQCIEEIVRVPASCLGNDSRCRQYIKARCVLPPTPTDCSQITCGPGMYCRKKKGGEGVKCARIRNCNQLICGEGLSCSRTATGPVCIQDEKPTTSPIATSAPTTVTDEVPTSPIATSAPTTVTDEVPTSPIATSAPTTVTDEVPTPFPNFCDFCTSIGQVCRVVNGSYQCTQPTECNSARIDYCLTFGQLCKVMNNTAECVFAGSCADIDCPRGTMCQEFGFAFCNPIMIAKTCEELNCERLPGQVCEQRNDSAACVVGCTTNLTRICESAMARCEVVNGVPGCVIPSTCAELECGVGHRCIIVELGNGTQNIARCVSETCEGVVCSTEGDACLQIFLPSRNFSLAQCVSPSITQSFPTIEQFMCSTASTTVCQPPLICTDVFQNGLFATRACSNYTTNCIDDTSCALNEVCTNVPTDLGVTVPFTKICLPMDKTIFELGVNCSSNSKQCPAGLGCQDHALEGVTIGSSCSFFPFAFASSCAELEPCQASQECFGYLIAGKGGLAQCADKATTDRFFQNFMSIIRVQ